jgi:MFS family permease
VPTTVLGLEQLPKEMRRNLSFEVGYGACTGVVSGLALLAQITAIGVLNGGVLAVTLITAAMPAASLLQPLWAELARHHRLKSMAIVSGVLRCLPLLAMGWATDAWTFTGLICLYYLLAGPVTLAVPSLYKYNYADSHRGRIIGLLRLVQNSVSVSIMLLAAWLTDLEPTLYQVLYPIGGVVGLIGLFFYQRLHVPDDDPRARALLSERPTWRNMQAVLNDDRHFRLFQTTIFLTGAGFLMSRPIWIALMKEDFGLSQLELSFLVNVMPLILGALTAPAWGALIDRTSPVAGRVAFALLGVFAYAALFLSFWLHWLVLAYVGAITRGLVLGAAEVATTAGNLYFSVRRERAALYESISSVFMGIRGLSMPLLGWLLYMQIHLFIFLLPTVLNLWSLFLAVKLWRLDQALRPEAALAKRLAILEAEAEREAVDQEVA